MFLFFFTCAVFCPSCGVGLAMDGCRGSLFAFFHSPSHTYCGWWSIRWVYGNMRCRKERAILGGGGWRGGKGGGGDGGVITSKLKKGWLADWLLGHAQEQSAGVGFFLVGVEGEKGWRSELRRLVDVYLAQNQTP